MPRAVLIENVIGFLTSHDSKFFRIALKELSKLGYYVDAFVIDAKYFVPQSLPRLFLLGFSPELIAEGMGMSEPINRPFWVPQQLGRVFARIGW